MSSTRIKLVIGLMTMCMSFSVFGLTETVNGITWTYIVDKGVARVGSGSITSKAIATTTSGSITIPSTLGGYTVTGISDYAFYYCDRLTKVTIPSTITSIGQGAFGACTRLTTVIIPNTVTSIGSEAFSDCSSLVSITIPTSLTIIKASAFARCTSLKNLVVPNGVTDIEALAFGGCSNLTSVVIPESVVKIGSGVFVACNSLKDFIIADNNPFFKVLSGFLLTKDENAIVAVRGDIKEVTIPFSVRDIGDEAFRGHQLTSVRIPDTVMKIGKGAFQACRNLVTVVIDDGTKDIGENAFLDCRELKSVEIGNAVTNISKKAFYYCPKLLRVSIGNQVEKIGDEAFYCCYDLHNLVIPESVSTICANAFHYCTGLTNVTIGAGITKIEKDSFSDCKGVRSVNIPQYVCNMGLSFAFPQAYTSIVRVVISEGATSIGEGTFKYCKEVRDVRIPNSMLRIAWGAFSHCNDSIFDVTTIPNVRLVDGWVVGHASTLAGSLNLSSVRGISDKAFSYCSNLTEVSIGRNLKSIGLDAFLGCSGLTRVNIIDLESWCKVSFGSNPLSYAHSLYLNGSLVSNMVIPHGLTSIKDSAFSGCTCLVNVTIPDSVVSIGHDVFRNCTALATIVFAGNAPEIDRNVFSGVPEQCHVLVDRDSTGWDVPIPGVWEGLPIDYTLYVASFDANGGMVNENERVVGFGLSIGELPTPTRSHYIFDGWFTLSDGGNQVASSYVLENDMTFYAHWVAEKYLVTFDANGGSGDRSERQDYGTEIVAPQVTRTGYTFVGWLPSVAATVPAEDVTYTAQWSINDYRVSFNANGGSGGTSDIRTYGTTITVPTVTRTGYVFKGWSPSVDATVPGHDVTYTAQWMPIKYIVTFDANGGEGGFAGEVDYDSEQVAPNVFREGYTFLGWTPEVAATVPLGGAAYTAQWQINQYDVVFDANGGFGGTSSNLDYGVEIIIPTVSRTGYTFNGWVPNVDATVPAHDVTYTAKWMPIKYTVIFDANGGQGGFDGDFEYESALIAPTVTRTGYTFKGWLPAVADVVPLGGATYTAQWQINQYNVTFDANGGTGGTSASLDYGTSIAAPTVTRTGYTFKSWSPSVAATVPANDVIYTAQWQINQYNVSFDANGGIGGTSAPQDYGTSIAAPTVTRAGYTFKGWSPSVAATVPANDVTYTAQWQINQYNVTFDANGGIGGTSGNQDYGTAIVAPTVTRTGYTFKGWLPSVAATVPANDVTYTAQWEINKYVVTFDANGGEGGTSGSQDYGTAIVAPTVTRTGYTFKGWSPAVAATVPANDVTYRAQWEINKYTVTFNANGGTGGTSGSQNYGTAITPPIVARTGYTFAGWSPGVAATVPANDVTYTAQWTPNAYAVTFDANGGIGGWSRNLDYDSAIVAPTVTRTGYTFKGWSPSVPTTVPLGGATYTAQWQINQYTVTFNANGGVGGKSTKQDYGTAIVTPTVTRTGYTFKGWSPSVMATVPAYNVTYTAQWEINKYTVTFDANGGTCETEAATVEHGAALGILPVPTRTQAVFLGWFTESGVRVDELTTVTCAVTLYAQWLTEVANPVVTTDWGSLVFRTNSCVVSISCATEGASIYYTDDGTTPKKNDNYLYAGPFTITDTTTIKAVAVIGDVQSEYVTVTITKKLLSLEEALDVEYGVSVAASANLPWRPILNLSAKVGDATARSGAISDRTNTWLSATVSGAGTMSFWCKVSCEHDDDNTFTWDRLMVYTNDVEVVEWRMDGETDWTRREVSFAGGENTVKWVYFKDRSISEGEDCAWVDGVTWTLADVAVDVGGGKSVMVPMDWIDAHSNIVMAVGGDKSAAMKSKAANGRKVWECYVLGLDPEKTADFKITSFPMKADGTPDLSAIMFEPEQSRWNLSGATPKLKGKATLDAEWQDVPPGGNPSFRFFTVEVQMP